MALESFRRIDPGQYKEAPEWFRRFIKTINRHFEDVITLLQGGLTAANENAEVVRLDILDGEATPIDHPNVKTEPQEVRILYSETAVTSYHWTMSAEGQVKLTVNFDGTPSTAQTINVYIRGT